MGPRDALVAAAMQGGASSPAVQKIVRNFCSLGRVEEAADAIAEVLVSTGVREHRVPVPRGLKTTGLVEKALLALKAEVETYAKTGVLCARGYYSAPQLTMLAIGKWEQRFPPPLQETAEALADNTSAEFNTRSAVAAQRLLMALRNLAIAADGEHLLLPMRDLEGFCVTAVRVMHTAFNSPDAAVHEMLHGKEE